MIVYDVEVFKHDWMICWLDTNTRKMHSIVNNKEKLEKFYDYYKNEIWVGYNSRSYDQWIVRAILCDFNPYDLSDWIINKGRHAFEFSSMLGKIPILNYDCQYFFRSLKELEAFMGDDIQESDVPFDIDRKLTPEEIRKVKKYCKHDVWETFKVFIETKSEFESHMGLIKEFNLPLKYVSKTKAQISAVILGASQKKWKDEFDIDIPDTLDLGRYDWIKDFYLNWAKNDRDYKNMKLDTDIAGVPHSFGVGGLHGAKKRFMGDGIFVLADVSSYYPALMIEYDFLSRNVSSPKKYRTIRDDRLKLKAQKDPREYPRKIVLNATFGASKDKYNNLYDPRQANNICIAGQLFLVDLIDKIEDHCEIIQSNTDGVLFKLTDETNKKEVLELCDQWAERTRMGLGYDHMKKVIQRDVNNYIAVFDNDYVKSTGSVVKPPHPLDNDLPIIRKAVVEYFVNNVPVEETIMKSDKLIDFQKVTKISHKYSHAIHNGQRKLERVFRVFASKDPNDGILYKQHKKKDKPDKTPSTPERCFIDNSDINGKGIPTKLDKQWYIDLARKRVEEFVDK